MAEDNGRTHEPSLRELTSDLDGLRELMDERDRRYGVQFADAKEAVASALTAQKELTSQAFLASKEAINKAESASNANDAKNNEFRSQLKDQASTFPTRIEIDNKVSSVDDKLNEFKKDFEKYKDQQAVEIRSLRESRSEGYGERTVITQTRARTEWSVGIILAVVFGVTATLVAVLDAVYLIISKASGH